MEQNVFLVICITRLQEGHYCSHFLFKATGDVYSSAKCILCHFTFLIGLDVHSQYIMVYHTSQSQKLCFLLNIYHVKNGLDRICRS
jgi:hypothetical protein